MFESVSPPVEVAARAVGWLERVLLLAGIALFCVLLYRIGVDSVWANVRLIGWGFVFTIGQECAATFFNTMGWRIAFTPPRPPIPFARLVAARLAGDAINNLTPTATVGGEVVRVRMLADVADTTALWASVAVAKLTQTCSQIGFIVVGLMYVLTHTALPAGIRDGMLIGLALLITGFAVAVALQRHGMFATGIRLAQRVGLPVPARVDEQMRQLDAEIIRLYRAPGAFLRSAAWFLAGWLCGVVEVYLILHFLEVGASWQRAVTIETLSIAIDAILFFVPAKAGTQEGGKVLIFTLLGLDPAKGLSLGIARRIRELTWSFTGLALLARRHARRGGARP